MENNTNYSHQSSGDSSPLSHEIDFENPDDNHPHPPSYKVKFMCSYGGKIQPRPHDPAHHLSYLGGDTKILSVDRSASFSSILNKLSSISNFPPSDFSFKYQLPGEDLDSLISVTNDEDLEHLMSEYDRLTRASPKPARLRIFLFPITSKPNSNSNSASEVYLYKEANKPDGSWFVDALNSVQFDNSPPPPTTPTPANPDFLFGFDKDYSAPNIPDLNDQVEPAAAAPVQYYQPVPVPMSAGYWPATADQHQQQPIYLIQTAAGGVYQQQNYNKILKSGGPITGESYGGQGYYNVPQMLPQPSSLIRQQVSYVDGAGRPVYWPPQGYQVVNAAAAGTAADNQAPQNSSV